MEETKVCSKCKKEKPLSEFGFSNTKSGIRQSQCRSCFSEYNRKRYEARAEEFKKARREYEKEHPESVLDTRLRMCSKNPNKFNANKAVNAAIYAGVIKNPGVCFGCGRKSEETRLSAHHFDYTRPLDVVWVCRRCHYWLDKNRARHEAEMADALCG